MTTPACFVGTRASIFACASSTLLALCAACLCRLHVSGSCVPLYCRLYTPRPSVRPPHPPPATHTALCLLIRRRSGLATHPLIAPMLVCVCPCVCVCSTGDAIVPEMYYALRTTFISFIPRPGAVNDLLTSLSKPWASSRAGGIGGFASYSKALLRALPALTRYFAAPKRLGAQEWAKGKKRAILESLLQSVAPNPQARALDPARPHASWGWLRPPCCVVWLCGH